MLVQPGVHTGAMELVVAGDDPELLKRTRVSPPKVTRIPLTFLSVTSLQRNRRVMEE